MKTSKTPLRGLLTHANIEQEEKKHLGGCAGLSKYGLDLHVEFTGFTRRAARERNILKEYICLSVVCLNVCM